MCGIIGAVSSRNVSSLLLNGLKQMEYRGYDSAGLSVYNAEKGLETCKVEGRVNKLEDKLKANPFKGYLGVAHTRWATHGIPEERNAHPILSQNEFAVVHNGIIENHDEIRTFLLSKNYEFTSDTDTEVIAHLLHYHYQETQDIITSLRKTAERLRGSYAVSVITSHDPGSVYVLRSGSPLVIGLGIDENFVASDQLALLHVCEKFIYLKDGDFAVVKKDSIKITDKAGTSVEREVSKDKLSKSSIELGEYRHYMHKEIAEQPDVILDTLSGNISEKEILDTSFGINSKETFDKAKAVQIVACGSSYHAALVAKYWIEQLVRVPCFVTIASEYRMTAPVVLEDTLLVLISQSGETADTLSALRLAKDYNYLASLAICNVPYSSLVRETDMVMYTRAGAEIGVASTKAFLTQLLAMLMLTICLAKRKNTKLNEQELVQAIKNLPDLLKQCLDLEDEIKDLASFFVEKHHALFLGRGTKYPIAMEGALKLKEISYIHAESYPAGELKHGPLALVDDNMPVVALIANDGYQDKMLANMQEVKARSGELFIFAEKNSNVDYSKLSKHVCLVPTSHELLKPIVYTIPMQLLAYHIAVLRGTDVDKPRNLAKSVTVE